MSIPENYALIINHITVDEDRFPDPMEEYRKWVFAYLNNTGRHLFEEDILERYSKGRSIEDIVDNASRRFLPSRKLPNPHKNGKPEPTWLDSCGWYEVKPDEDYFDFFFACKLRQLDYFHIDFFLDYHLHNSFSSDVSGYLHFLKIVQLKFKHLLSNPDLCLLVNDWTEKQHKKQQEPNGCDTDLNNQKGQIKRQAGDNLTDLSLEQTAMLIANMQEARIFIQKDRLNNKRAGLGVSELTWYSAGTIRQNLDVQTTDKNYYKNMGAVIDLVTRLKIQLDKKYKNRNKGDLPL